MAADKIAILGAGSVGCFIGGAWQAAGLPVTFIGRERIAGDIRRHGLTVTDYSGWQVHLDPGEVDYQTGPQGLCEADVIALCVKSGATGDAARDIGRYGREGALIISFQNGISNFDVLSQELGHRFEIARGMVPYNCAYLGDGHIHKGAAGAQLSTEDRDSTRSLAARIGEGPAALDLFDDMLGITWGKLLINLNNAINALSGRPLLAEISERKYRKVFAAAMREGLAILAGAGIRPAKIGDIGPRLMPMVIDSPDWLFNRVFIKKWKIDAKARSSMSDDLARGRKTEVDYINGELVALAKRLGLEAPINRRIVALIRAAEAGAPPLNPQDLERAVLGR